jgi:putative lysine transport system substrate-binding protein
MKAFYIGNAFHGFFICKTSSLRTLCRLVENFQEDEKMKKVLALSLALAMALSLFAGCGSSSSASSGAGAASGSAASGSASGSSSGAADTSKIQGLEDGVFTIAMECAYAPYNWSQTDDSNGAVPIKDSTEYANGYDVMIGQKIADALGVKLEVVRLDWDSLIPAVQTGRVDANIAGQSMTAKRAEQVDFAGPYIYATIVCLTLKTSKYASAKGISDLSGGSCTSQLGTIWYDSCLPQIKDANIKEAKESAPAMLMALETGDVDYVCTDMPTAQAALIAYPDMTLLNFADSGDDFKVSDEDVNIGIAVQKGNSTLKDAINSVLKDYTADDFNNIMNEAIKVQPLSK